MREKIALLLSFALLSLVFLFNPPAFSLESVARSIKLPFLRNEGAYKYDPVKNELVLIVPGDIRVLTGEAGVCSSGAG